MSAAFNETARHHRVYGLPERAPEILRDIHQGQIGKYIVSVPCFPGDEDDPFNEGAFACRAVVDDFGNLRRVQ